ncbi:hypothetical protein KDL01_20995 [Actinospica durhamensis]|uniref:Hemerythrin-like domain-containing protein n=1 Tax=Actinospica durhamensis TaxID=1508375 RepID=A0A941ERD3_9ACTN|nr:hemerythrin domain-containing protein [Actinospica durhamensis]MBR7835763.1 hypothetical protein [Actinospica durhamensis]
MNSTVGVGSVLSILHDQHMRTRELLHHVADSSGPERRRAFDALRRLLAVHEAAEDFVLRPAARMAVPRPIVLARIGEERQATDTLERLELLDLASRAFREGFLAFTVTLLSHMWHEETHEWLPLETSWSEEQQLTLGARLRRAFGRDPAGAGPAGEIELTGFRPSPVFGALFQEAVDRLAESRPGNGASGYFEIATAGARVCARTLPDRAAR